VGSKENIGHPLKFGIDRAYTPQTYVAYFNHMKAGVTAEDSDCTPPVIGGKPRRYSCQHHLGIG
jgi:hypothetical protein